VSEILVGVNVGTKKDERDYRSLERERMYSIFAPLDERDAPQGPDESRVIISGRGAWMLVDKPRRRRRP
jgi:hypothetical protein